MNEMVSLIKLLNIRKFVIDTWRVNFQKSWHEELREFLRLVVENNMLIKREIWKIWVLDHNENTCILNGWIENAPSPI